MICLKYQPLVLMIIANLLFAIGCSTLSYREYVVAPPTQINPALREKGTYKGQGRFNERAMKVSYNDGKTVTEVEIPILTTGQAVIIAHTNQSAMTTPTAVPPPPSKTDQELQKSYVERGLTIKKGAPAVSIIDSHKQVQDLVGQSNFALALQVIENVLKKYPQHPEFLRMKGSCLLSIGEKNAAIEAYEKAQSVDPDSQVESLLKNLYQEISGGH